ncbi:unnamed protein product, partial [Meganyctiphanes norvegica]
FNFLWSNHIFPDQWRNAHVIPIPKPNKPPTNINSYRPISLTITLCKLMEKMVKNRLMHFLNTNNVIVNYQYGFQKAKSTLDPLTHLEYAIRDTIIKADYLIAGLPQTTQSQIPGGFQGHFPALFYFQGQFLKIFRGNYGTFK